MKKITWNAPVILWFTLLSAIALLADFLTHGKANRLLFSVYRGSLSDPLFYLRLFTHVLGHASLSHYTGNMMLFLLVGPLLEEKYGSRRLLGIMALVALVTGIVHVLISANTMLLGASGIVFAFILLASVTGTRKGIPLTMIIVAVIYISEQVYQGFTAADSISQLTHIIGGCIGAICGLFLKNER
ncbi:MAG: rhomboid family intramembrane serine protease [Solobacterium sp.]|nr:rhomboid family intramembrane serine protease [Solobacterium sp.]